MKKQLLLSLIILLVLSLPARADQVSLKNGDRLSGKIVKSDGKTLVIKTEFAGEVTVQWDAVSSIASDQPIYMQLADGRTVSGLVTTSGDQIQVASAGAVAVTTNKAGILALRSPEEQAEVERLINPGWTELWSGSASLAYALTTGNSKTSNLSLGLAATRETTQDKTTAYAAALFARDSTEGFSRTTANLARGGLRYEHNFTKKWFGYGFTDLEHNDLQDLNVRVVLGGGAGYHAIKNERTQVDLLAGANWNKEYFIGPDRSSAELNFGQTLSYQLNPRSSLKEQLFYFPNLSNGGEYRINFDTVLLTEINKRFGWQLTFSDRYLSDPPFGLEKNDMLFTTGITYKIGKSPK
jgi:putative salt-induced outer membrane protein YdiY